MGVLSRRSRCIRCGVRVPEPVPVQCPNCQSDLAQVGTWSELREWAETRKLGRTQYVWRHWLFCWAFLAIAWSLGAFFSGNRVLIAYVWIVSVSLTGGYILGQRFWNSAEREYQAAQDQTNRPI